jgi:hypothetical protein
VGSYNECRSEFYINEGKQYAIVQTVEKSRGCLYEIDIEKKSMRPYSNNGATESESILAFDKESNLLITKHSTPNSVTYAYANLPNPLTVIQPVNE